MQMGSEFFERVPSPRHEVGIDPIAANPEHAFLAMGIHVQTVQCPSRWSCAQFLHQVLDGLALIKPEDRLATGGQGVVDRGRCGIAHRDDMKVG